MQPLPAEKFKAIFNKLLGGEADTWKIAKEEEVSRSSVYKIKHSFPLFFHALKDDKQWWNK